MPKSSGRYADEPSMGASGRSDKERPDVVLAEDVCNRYFVVVRSSAVAGNGSPQRREGRLLANCGWRKYPRRLRSENDATEWVTF